MPAHVPSFGRNPRGSPDFLAYPVPKACMHVLGTRVPRRLGVARSASSPKAALASGCSLTPGLRISFGRVTCMARAASVPGLWALGFLLLACVCGWVRVAVGRGFPLTPALRGWGLGWVCLGSVCGVVPLLPAVCGVRGWALVSACFRDVCGFVRVSVAPRRFRFRCAVWACVLGPGLGCAPRFLAGGSGCVFCAFLFFFFRCWVSLSRALWSLPPSPFFRAGLLAFFFLLVSVPLFPVGRCSWLGAAGFGWVVPLCLFGVLSSVPSGWGVWPPSVLLAGGLVAVGCFPAPPPLHPPLFFGGGGGGLAVPPFAFPRLALALWLVCGVVGPSPLLAEVPVCYSPPLLAGFRCRWWWAVPATPGWGPLAAVVCGVWCVAVVCWWGCGWCVVWLVPRHSWRRFLCATPRHSWLGFAAGGGGRSPPLLAGVRWRRCWWCVVCGGGVLAGLWLVCGVADPSPLLAEVPVCYSPPLLAGFRCRWWLAVPATPGWGPLAALVCGVWCVVCGVWRWCVGGVLAGVWCGWSLATPGGGSCVLLPATPGWVSLPVVVGGPRHSWLGSSGGGGVWCVVCGVWRWCVVGVVVGVWCGRSLATPGGGLCVLLPATPGWVSLPVVVGGPRHSWLGSVGGVAVWCVVCGGGVLAGLWLVCGVAGPSPLLAVVPVCYSPPLLAGFRCRWWWAFPATPGWGPLAAVVCGVWCVVCGAGVLLGLWPVGGVVGPSPLLAEVPVCYSPPLLAGFRCRWCWAVPATPGWGPLAAVVCGVCCVVCGVLVGSLATPGGGSCVLLPATPGWVSLPLVVGGPRHSWLGSVGGGGVWCVFVCVLCLAGSGGPASRARSGAPHVVLWPLCLSALLGPLRAGVAPLSFAAVAVPRWLFFSAPRCLALRALAPRLCLPLGRWLLFGGCSPAPLPFCVSRFSSLLLGALVFFFSFFFFLCAPPLSLAFSGFQPRVPWASALALFALLAFRFWALRALVPLSCFPPGCWLLPRGCRPPPPLCPAVFVPAARCCVPCCAVRPWVRCCAALLRVVSPGVVLSCAVLRSFGAAACCAVPSGAARRPGALCSAALCFAVFSRVVCSVLCVFCRGAVVHAVVRRFALRCVCLGVLCCAFPVLSVLCGAVLRCAGAPALCCSCGACCCWRLVLWCAAVCCAVSCGVPWCGAGSGGPWLSAGGVFRRRCPCLAAWSASLWLVWFAVVPCFPVSCSVVLCCRVVLCCCPLLSRCGAVGACFALLWAVVLCCAVLLVGCAVFGPALVSACCGALFLVLCVPCLLRSVRCGALLCWLWCPASLCRVLWCCAVVLCCRFAVLFVFALPSCGLSCGASVVCAVVGASCCGVSLCVVVSPRAFCGVVVLLWCVVVSCCAVRCPALSCALCRVLRCRAALRCCAGWLCCAVVCAAGVCFSFCPLFLCSKPLLFFRALENFLKTKNLKCFSLENQTLRNSRTQASSNTKMFFLTYALPRAHEDGGLACKGLTAFPPGPVA